MLVPNLLSNHLFSLSSVLGASLFGVEFAYMSEVDLKGHRDNEVPPEAPIVSIRIIVCSTTFILVAEGAKQVD